MSAWEDLREACREMLLELASAENAHRLESPQGYVEVKQFQTASLPKAGTPQRQELADLITQAQRWPDVAYPSAARLQKALAAGLFTAEQAGEVARLCPVQTVYRLEAHQNK